MPSQGGPFKKRKLIWMSACSAVRCRNIGDAEHILRLWHRPASAGCHFYNLGSWQELARPQ
eukprot:6107978-Amphidinium_carterae.1